MFEQTAICLVNAATEAAPYRLGTIISCHRDRVSAQLDEIAFRIGERHMPRTRLLRLKRAMAPGTTVHPEDLAPV
jgi:hypothetical protein